MHDNRLLERLDNNDNIAGITGTGDRVIVEIDEDFREGDTGATPIPTTVARALAEHGCYPKGHTGNLFRIGQV